MVLLGAKKDLQWENGKERFRVGVSTPAAHGLERAKGRRRWGPQGAGATRVERRRLWVWLNVLRQGRAPAWMLGKKSRWGSAGQVVKEAEERRCV